MQTSLEAAEIVNEGLFQENQRLAADYSNYHDLFQFSPTAYLLTDASGVILEANEAIAQLLNVPQGYLVGKPLAAFVVEDDLQAFYTQLNGLSPTSEVKHWQMRLSTWKGKPFEAQLHIAIVLHDFGFIRALRITVFNQSQFQKTGAQLPLKLSQDQAKERIPMSQLPQSLDGLRVLVVDDEADIREFITVVLESYGISVKAVASAAAALEALEQFQPDVLVSDIRMPGGSGYNLIRQIRDLEAKQGGHLPAAAITAYLDEDWEKSLNAGYEAHLHKLAQPSEWVEMVAQLARHA
ncbi:response regulator [Gloeocapsopsis dulcis]|uniref:response regulator n=1 Tax=Gloeocapsopsis dulcis TaxID=2859516 RepID=UPI001F3FEC96|nr:response regulator [Gloeocapsopsis dulcis]WNN89059.1 response regulator [Gloeocapsopsis dulcis]